ncbi:type II toxin-antitoxin system VapC family toxin [Brevundimonas aurifodinae]|uniref:PIN domain-containing protein n=1 Tax=Brevundimonas aurifodinae TaxID=1508312 RepID=A0ABV1NPL1_9CAUL
MEARGQLILAVHLDTNVLLWLSQGRLRSLGEKACRLAVRQPWVISPMVVLELEILHEIGRIKAGPDQVLAATREYGTLRVSDLPLSDVVREACDLSWTRDPIDRLVTAHAIADGTKLLTADKTILTHFADAVWD